MVIELWFMISRSTDVLKARTCALGCERHRIVAGRRHCIEISKHVSAKD